MENVSDCTQPLIINITILLSLTTFTVSLFYFSTVDIKERVALHTINQISAPRRCEKE